mgnify:CR=1 FL=1
MRFTNKQYVRWGDLDAFGHVNNSTYLIFAQEARYAWSKMHEMVVARAEVDFIAPIYTGDIYIDVEIWVNKIGTSSFLSILFEIQGVIITLVIVVSCALFYDLIRR